MLSKLTEQKKVVGLKQSKKAITDGTASHVFLAEDADPALCQPLEALCQEHAVPLTWIPTMRELGSACGIEVGAAVAACLK